MAVPEDTFPSELLNRPWPDRLEYFRAYTMGHARLVAARDTLMTAIRGPEPPALILVIGPTGVGKTTLRHRIEELLIADLSDAMATDAGRLPYISVEAVAPESGNFNWRDHYRRLLFAGAEPLVDDKRPGPAADAEGLIARPYTPGARATGAEYQYAVEQMLRHRRPAAVLIDEAQHLAIMAAGRKLSDQADVIKSMANRTGTPHVLFGTDRLINFRNLSGQLSRRSLDIHLPRYQREDPEQWKQFLMVLRTFEVQLPLRERPDLVRHAEFVYERGLGLVGVVKEWLMRALAPALAKDRATLTLRDLERHALSVAQCQQILSEAQHGEEEMAESPAARARLRTALGLDGDHTPAAHPAPAHARHSGPAAASSGPRKRQPGRRWPVRDKIGSQPANERDASCV